MNRRSARAWGRSSLNLPSLMRNGEVNLPAADRRRRKGAEGRQRYG